jgi:hypothetical protein
MPKLDEQISTLQEKYTQLQLRRQHIAARRQAIVARRERKMQTRRSILVGTIVMAKAEQGELDPQLLLVWLDHGLSRADDRALFDLPRELKTGV